MGNVMLLLVEMVVILLHFCNAGKDLNVTYVEEKKSWMQANAYCQVHGGVLENNITVIKQHYNGKQGVWIGTYMSPWVGYYGCYQLNTTKLQVHIVENEDFFECQMFCPLLKYEYFSVQGTKCYCVEDIIQEVKFNMCICTNCKYFKIYKQNIYPDRRGASAKNGTGLCIAAECTANERNLTLSSAECTANERNLTLSSAECTANERNLTLSSAECTANERNLTLSSEDCSRPYKVLCDKSTDKSTDASYNLPQQKALHVCRYYNSSLKWFTEKICKDEPTATGQHWTSITRKKLHLSMNDSKNASLNPEICGIGKSKNGTEDLLLSFVKCNMSCSFFCRFGEIDDDDADNDDNDGDENITPTTSNGNETSPSPLTESGLDSEELEITGIVIGVIAAGVTVIVIVVIVLMYRRKRRNSSIPTFSKDNQKLQRLSKSDDLNHERANNEIIYHEIDTKSPNYSLATATNFKRDNSEEDPHSTRMSGDNDRSNASAERGLYVDIKQADGHGNAYDNRKLHHNENRSPRLFPNNTPGQTTTKIDNDRIPNTLQSNASISKDMHASDYCLATPVVEEDEYATNKNYDHLHNVQKKEDNSGYNVYDHLPDTLAGDVTYDHSNFTASRSANDNYDHFNIQLKQE